MTGLFSKATKVLSVPMLKPAEPALQKFIQQVRLPAEGCGGGGRPGCLSVYPAVPPWLALRPAGPKLVPVSRGLSWECWRRQGGRRGIEWGNPRKRLTFLEAGVGAGPLLGQHPEGAQSLAVGSQAGVGAGTLGGKRKPQ